MCMNITFTNFPDLLDSSFTGFSYEGSFGRFETDRYILFNVGGSGLDMHLLAVIPCAIIGILGGVTGAAFTFANLKVARARRSLHSK